MLQYGEPFESQPGNSETLKALSSIFPPKTGTKNGKSFIQPVSASPATIEDVFSLHKSLETSLKEGGRSVVQWKTVSECFDELIRQITIDMPERGLLLFRLKKEIEETFRGFEEISCSAVLFGVRKVFQIRTENSELEKKLLSLEEEKEKLLKEFEELQKRQETEADPLAQTRKAQEEKIRALKRKNTFLKAQLFSVIGVKK